MLIFQPLRAFVFLLRAVDLTDSPPKTGRVYRWIGNYGGTTAIAVSLSIQVDAFMFRWEPGAGKQIMMPVH